MYHKEYAQKPEQCYACKRLFLPKKRIINHHITYFPEYIVHVHPACHTKIHWKTGFSHLLPDIRQTMRWYRKLGKWYKIDIFDWEFGYFWDRLWFTLMTEEQRQKFKNHLLDEYWKRCAIIMQQKTKELFE